MKFLLYYTGLFFSPSRPPRALSFSSAPLRGGSLSYSLSPPVTRGARGVSAPIRGGSLSFSFHPLGVVLFLRPPLRGVVLFLFLSARFGRRPPRAVHFFPPRFGAGSFSFS